MRNNYIRLMRAVVGFLLKTDPIRFQKEIRDFRVREKRFTRRRFENRTGMSKSAILLEKYKD